MQQKPDSRPASSTKSAPIADSQALVALAQAFLEDMKCVQPADGHLARLETLDFQTLVVGLTRDGDRQAFWINLYNAFHIHCVRQEQVTGRLSKYQRYFGRACMVAGMRLSLNDIEHSILRRSRWWWARGYLRKPWESRALAALRVDALDPRIHFSLNCGATSCPPIMSYSCGGIDRELEIATQSFMLTEVQLAADGRLAISGLFGMYAGDFGGRKGILEWIARYRPELSVHRLKLRYLPFDWTPMPDKFV